MKPLIAIFLLVVAAGSVLFLVNKKDAGVTDDSGTSTIVVEPSDETPDDTGAPNLVNVDEGGTREAPTMVQTVDTSMATPSAALAGHGEVSGRVVDEAGNPLIAARVVLTLFGSQTFNLFEDYDRSKDTATTTSNEGIYRFDRVPAKEGYSLVITHPDFSRTEAPNVFVDDGVATTVPDIVMTKGRALRGTVTDSGGNAVVGAKLVLNQNMFAIDLEGVEDPSDQMEIESGDGGAYEFKNIAPKQNYSLSVSADGYGRVLMTDVAVVEAEDTVRDVVLEVASMLAGIVRASDGAPVEGTVIEAWATDQTKRKVHARTKSLVDGSFEFTDVPPGNYQLVARHPLYSANARERADSGSMSVVIELQPLPTVSGQVVDLSTGRPITRCAVQLRAEIVGSPDGATQGLKNTLVQVDDPEGRFTMISPRAGNYIAEAKADGFADTYSDRFESVMGQSATGIMIRMTRGGQLLGRIVDESGVPIKGAVVESHDANWADDPFSAMLGDIGDASEKTKTTGQDGSFTMKGMSPANYKLLVRHKSYAQEIIQDLSVSEGNDTRTDDIVLTRGAVISGTVYGPGGGTLAGAQVKVYRQTAGGRNHTAQTGPDGTFAIRNVRGGVYMMHAIRPRSASDNPFVSNIDQKQTQREITVKNGQELTGQELRLTDR